MYRFYEPLCADAGFVLAGVDAAVSPYGVDVGACPETAVRP
ncbi:MAG: hypothetical protein AAF471_07950 [Myxococcota bacterium]